MTEVDRTDIELCLLGGRPVNANGIYVYPVTFNQVISPDIKYSAYNRAIKTFCIDISQLNDILKQKIEINYLYNCLCLFSVENLDIRNDILLILKLVTRSDVSFDVINNVFLINDDALDSNTFLQIQKIIKIRNGLENIREETENPADERTRRLLEQSKKYREQLRESKHNASLENITIVDLLGTAACTLHLELSKIYEYDIYQLNDQINRVKNSKDYDTNIQALLHGADSKEIDLKYWMCSNKANYESDSDEDFNSDNYEF